MKIADRTSLAYILTSVFGLYLLLFSFFSFNIFVQHLVKGSAEYADLYIPCGPVFLIILTAVIWLLNSYNAFTLKKTVMGVSRVFYIFLFYPLLVLILITAGLVESLQPVLVSAFPVFLIGAVLLPYCSYVIYRETKAGDVIEMECHSCRYTFEIGTHEKEMECPVCGALNENILVLKDD